MSFFGHSCDTSAFAKEKYLTDATLNTIVKYLPNNTEVGVHDNPGISSGALRRLVKNLPLLALVICGQCGILADNFPNRGAIIIVWLMDALIRVVWMAVVSMKIGNNNNNNNNNNDDDDGGILAICKIYNKPLLSIIITLQLALYKYTGFRCNNHWLWTNLWANIF